MGKNFLQNVVEKSPDIIGRIIYFCTRGGGSLECILKANGTISPIWSADKEYSSAGLLVKDLLDGVIAQRGFAIGAKATATKLKFADDLFLNPNRSGQIRSLLNGTNDSKISDGRRVSGCNGFKISAVPMSVIKALKKDEIVATANDYLRSAKCEFITFRVRSAVCDPCYKLRRNIRVKLNKLRKKKRLCNGFSVVAGDQNPVEGGILKARIRPVLSCRGVISTPGKRKCRNCRTNGNKNKARRSRTTDPEKRLLFTPNRYLSIVGQREKLRLMIRSQKRRVETLRRSNAAALARKQRETKKFKPTDPSDQAAVASLTKYFNEESAKCLNSICRWNDNDQCGHEESKSRGLWDHVNSVHIRQQFDECKHLKPLERRYYCRWTGCRRKAPFRKKGVLMVHIKQHLGSTKAISRLNMLREQVKNMGRSASGRRWTSAAKTAALENYTSRGAWIHTVEAAGVPLPSLSTIMRTKNTGGVRPGIDGVVIERVGRICNLNPAYDNGILVFDEVYIRPGIDFNNADDAFGFAENGNVGQGELANAVLVFQYVSIFAPQKFRVNIAWYPVRRCDASWLKNWLLQVLCALFLSGIKVSALVCDGSSVNRNVQKLLLESSGNGQDGSFCFPPSSTNRIYVLSDPSHCIKKLRNNWLLGRLRRNNQKINWWYVVRSYEWQQNARTERLDRPLTEKHLCIDKSSRMCVRTAVDVFSQALEDLIEQELGDQEASNETRFFMKHCRQFWMAVNSRRPVRSLTTATEAIFEPLQWVSGYFNDWKEASSRNEFLTRETYEDLQNICTNFPALVRYLLTSVMPGLHSRLQRNKISQDLLEKDFGIFRMKCGGTRNPTLKSLSYNIRSVNMRRLSRAECACSTAYEE